MNRRGFFTATIGCVLGFLGAKKKPPAGCAVTYAAAIPESGDRVIYTTFTGGGAMVTVIDEKGKILLDEVVTEHGE